MENAEMPGVHWKDIKFFSPREFVCKCGCGRVEMDEDFLLALDELRGQLGRPLIVNSGYRCPEYNAEISTTGKTGPHTTGKAADLRVFGHVAHSVVGMAGSMGFTGVGIAQKGGYDGRFVHLDMLSDGEGGAPRPWIWTY